MKSKHIRKVDTNKHAIWIYGKHAVKAALLNPQREISRFIILESTKDFVDECGDISIKSEIVDRDFFTALFGRDSIHQGCAIFTKKLPEVFLEDIIEDEKDSRPIIFLDQVKDPQNIGTVLRAAAVLGARAVVVTENNTPQITPVIAKAASGALEIIPLIRIVNLFHTVKHLKEKGFWCVGLDENAKQKMHEISLDGKFIFIIGSEGEGMRRLSKEACDFLVQLPSFGNFSTLNAAQAATISLYESARQRIAK